MGFFASNKPSSAAADATAPSKTSTVTDDISQQELKRKASMEAEQHALQMLVEGAPNMEAAEREARRFAGSNTRHMYADGVLGVASYTLSGLQHMHGQSNALALLSMWAAGTTFLMNGALRKYLHDNASPTTSSSSSSAGGVSAPKEFKQAEQQASEKTKTTAATTVTTNNAAYNNNNNNSELTNALGSVESQRRNVFQLEAVASWVWMLTSMQQFKMHKRLKWCGYSSWMGLGLSMYFTLRHMYCVLVE